MSKTLDRTELRENCTSDALSQSQSSVSSQYKGSDVRIFVVSPEGVINTMDVRGELDTTSHEDETEQDIIANPQEPDKLPAPVPNPRLSSSQTEICSADSAPMFGPSAQERMRERQCNSGIVTPKTSVPLSPNSYHHRNFWLGPEPVKNTTDPAMSLAILTSPLKGFMAMSEFTHEPRKHVLAWNAHRLIDPVVYLGDFDALCKKSISERRDFAIGQVFKYYTQTGLWQWDDLDDDESEPWVDFQLGRCCPDGWTVINGYVDSDGQPTHESLAKDMAKAAKANARKRKAFSRKRSSSGFEKGFGPSPLRKSYTPELMLAEEKEDEFLLLLKRRATRSRRAEIDCLKPESFERGWADLDSDIDSDSSDD